MQRLTFNPPVCTRFKYWYNPYLMKDLRSLNSLMRDMIKYGFVAVFALIADAGCLFTLHALGVNYLVSATIAFLIGTVVNFILSHGFVFKDPVIKNRGVNFLAYTLIGAVSLIFNYIIIWFCYSQVGWSLLVAKCTAVVIVFFWNFLARRYFLYNGHKSEIGKEISFEA